MYKFLMKLGRPTYRYPIDFRYTDGTTAIFYCCGNNEDEALDNYRWLMSCRFYNSFPSGEDWVQHKVIVATRIRFEDREINSED